MQSVVLNMIFLKECKKVLFSVPFLLLALAVFLMYYTQLESSSSFLSGEKKITAPQPGGNFGPIESEDPELVVPTTLQTLYAEFTANDFSTYPIGFIRHVKLNEADLDKMADILSDLTGKPASELLKAVGSGSKKDAEYTLSSDGAGGYIPSLVESSGPLSDVLPKEELEFDRFQELMAQADKLLGGGSSYAASNLSASRPMTYEEALAEYTANWDIDHFSGTHARLFADYMTLFTGLLAGMLAVAAGLRDRRAKMRELIWTRKISSLRLAAARYFAVVALSMLPILLLAAVNTVRVIGLYPGEQIDILAFFTYSLGWILPTVMATAAIGTFLTQLFESPLGIAALLLYWFLDVNGNIYQIGGGYAGLPLNPRHNTLGRSQLFSDQFSVLLTNRLFFVALALFLLAATALILEYKRKKGKAWK